MNYRINYKTMDYMNTGIIIEDMEKSEIMFVNRIAKKLLKITSKDKVTSIRQFLSSDIVYNELKEYIANDINDYKKSEGKIYFKSLDGTFIEVKFCCTWLYEEGKVLCYTFKNVVEVVGESEISFKELTEQLPNGIMVMDIENELSILYANNEHYKILGITDKEQNELKGYKPYSLKDFIFEEDVHWVLSEIYMNLLRNEDIDIEFRVKARKNVIKWVRLFGRGNISASGEKLFYATLKDLSERRSINDKLHMERVLFNKITELTDETLFRLDLNTNIIYFLGSKSSIFGEGTVFENYPESLIKLKKVHKDDATAHSDLIYCFQKGIEKPIELRYKVDEKLDLYEWFRITYSFINNDDGKPISAIGKMVNINTQKLLEERAKTDLLTGFYNKATIEQEVDRLIAYKNQKSFALFIIDIDDFKNINDNLGHHFGDMVLTGIADDIKSCFRQDDIFGRIGGDEFVIVLRDTWDTGVIVQKAELICKTLNKSFSGGTNFNHKISASVGISMYPSDGNTFDELYQKSDKALCEVKVNGKNNFKQYFNNSEEHNIVYTPNIDKNDNRKSPILINNTIMTAVLNLLYESKDLESTIFLVLGYIGKMFKLDKCYIFETWDKGKTYSDNYSWYSDKYQKTLISKGVKKENIENILQSSDENGVFYTNDIASIKDEWLKKALQNAGVKSIFLVDSQDKYSERDIFFIEDCKSKRVWSNEEIITLLHVSRLIFNVLNQYNIINKIKSNSLNEEILNKNDLINEFNVNSLVNYNKIANVICGFYDEKNRDISTSTIIQNMIRLFNIDCVTSMVYNNKTGEYFKTSDFSLDGKIKNYSDKLVEQYKKYVNTFSTTIEDEKVIKFLSLFNEQNYIYTDDFDEIKDDLLSAGYILNEDKNIKEIYVFAIKYKGFFSYLVFERYGDNKLLDAEINILTALCKVINSDIEKFNLVQNYEDDILIKDVILKNESIPMAVVEKDTFKMLYFNELYSNIFTNIEIGEVQNELIVNKKRSSKQSIDDDLLISNVNHSEHQWIRKAIPFTLNNGAEVYMIYLKDSIDYVNQVNAVDNLTQALLLRGFEENYKNFIQKNEYNYALCVIDIDKFKYINEIFDYKTGDKVLRQVAIVIRDFIENDEIFCRMNGDKFAILLRYEDEVELHIKMKELSSQFENMRIKYFTDTKITIIGGVTLVDKKLTLNVLLDQATIARKSAKGSHKNRFSYYNPEIDSKIKKEIQLEEQIPNAIENNEFVAYLQPKFDLNTKKISGAEALVRWVTPKGMIYPDTFIPLFERNGFILTLDFIIYENVMKHIRRCLDNDLPVYPISVNVSRNHIQDKNFLSKFMELIKKYDIPHKYLELEITESIFVEDKQQLKDFVNGIKINNLKISIDDFGTAYSSLQNLTDIDIDILKIDKGFLDNIDMTKTNITKDEILLKNIINLAKELDFKVICEGIETNEQIELLKKNGCEYGQGYVFARPMPIEDYEKQFLHS